MCVTHVVRDVVVTPHINANKHVVIVWQALRVYPKGFESPVSNATDTLGARHVLTTTRKNKENKKTVSV